MLKLQSGDSIQDLGSLASEDIAETLLIQSGTAGRLPTDEIALLGFLNLRQLSFDFGEEFSGLLGTRDKPRNLRALLSLDDRIVATHSKLDAKRCRWSVFHEISHFILPEHVERLFFDTDRTLSDWTHERFEREANRLAAELVFQGSRFTEEAISSRLSCNTVLELAPQYGASYESGMRRFVERHVQPCAVIVYERVSDGRSDFEDEKYRIHYTVTSVPFRKKYFYNVSSEKEFSTGSDICRVHGSWNIGNVIDSELIVHGKDERFWRFRCELFTNGYKIFQFLLGEIA